MKNVSLMTVKMICLVGKETVKDGVGIVLTVKMHPVLSALITSVLVGRGCSVAEFIRLLVELYKQSYKFCYTAPFVSPGCIRVCMTPSGSVAE